MDMTGKIMEFPINTFKSMIKGYWWDMDGISIEYIYIANNGILI